MGRCSRRLLLLVTVVVAGPQVATLHGADPFSVVLLPDTQNYSEKYPETYIAQTLWIRQQLKQDNSKFAIHLGDIVQTAGQEPEWENASLAMRLLDGVVPYSVAPGNHDMIVKDRDTSF